MNDRGVLFESDNKDEAYSQFRAATVLARHPHGFATGRNVILKDGDKVIIEWSPDNPVSD
jgi:hypothetical protein